MHSNGKRIADGLRHVREYIPGHLKQGGAKADPWRKSWNHSHGFCSERGRKAGKTHVCDICGAAISVGARYIDTTVCENGRFDTLRTCMTCVGKDYAGYDGEVILQDTAMTQEERT